MLDEQMVPQQPPIADVERIVLGVGWERAVELGEVRAPRRGGERRWRVEDGPRGALWLRMVRVVRVMRVMRMRVVRMRVMGMGSDVAL